MTEFERQVQKVKKMKEQLKGELEAVQGELRDVSHIRITYASHTHHIRITYKSHTNHMLNTHHIHITYVTYT